MTQATPALTIDLDKLEALAPCPFCGGSCQLTHGFTTQGNWPDGDFSRVFCTVCQARQLFHKDDAAATAAWNRRASLAAPAATAEPIGEVMAKPDNEHGTLAWPRAVWKDGLFALPPVGTKLYAAAPTTQPVSAPTLTAEQIAAGAAVQGDDGKPVGRNTAIMVFDAMGGHVSAPEATQPAAAEVGGLPRIPTEAMLNAARDWSVKKYNQGIGNDAAIGCWQAMFDAAPNQEAEGSGQDAMSQAARDVLAERRRQVEAEGWTPERDDQYQGGEISLAAACYALQGEANDPVPPEAWPWAHAWWKPAGARRNLVKAGALILADIDRIDRAAMSASPATPEQDKE